MKLRNILIIPALVALAGCSNIPASQPCYISVADCMQTNRAYFEMQARSNRANLPTQIHRVGGSTVILHKGWRSTTVLD